MPKATATSPTSVDLERLRNTASDAASQLSDLAASMVRARSDLRWEHRLSGAELQVIDEHIQRIKAIVGMLNFESRSLEPEATSLDLLLKMKRLLGTRTFALLTTLGVVAGVGAGEEVGAAVVRELLTRTHIIEETADEQLTQEEWEAAMTESLGWHRLDDVEYEFIERLLHVDSPTAELLRLRTEYGLSQDVAGGLLGISSKAMANWERGIDLPTDADFITTLEAQRDSLQNQGRPTG